MPLLLLNLRAQPSGLESHRKFLKVEAASWLGEQCKADITFTCIGHGDGGPPVQLAGHQAVLAPLSPLLREIFNQHSCGHKSQMVDITIQADPQVMKSVLTLVYRGITTLSTMAVEELKSIVKMLNLTFPGGFERVVLAGSEIPALYPSPELKPSLKRSSQLSPRFGDHKKARSSNITTSNKTSATDRMNMHVSMTLQLKDAPIGTTATCNMPHCGAEVTHEQLSDHFLVHETTDGSNISENPDSFPCVACGISFKYRKELDTHTKIKHGGGSTKRDKLDLLSESDSSDEETLGQFALKEKSWGPASKTEALLPESSHSEYNADNYCTLCNHTFKTTKAKKVHMQMKHSSNIGLSTSKKNYTSLFNDSKPLVACGINAPNSWKKYGCQICTKRFDDFCKLRTHYTLHHFWDNLSEDFKTMGDECNICMKKFPTEDHLLQHMGNFHCAIDKYLLKKGFRIISEERSVKLLSWKCEFCKLNMNSSAALKSHLAVKHYQKELVAEFPVERDKAKKCPKCYKGFESSSLSTVVAHIGSFHDEVVKYAIDQLDLDEEDKSKIPVDDFDDNSICVPLQKKGKESTFRSTFDYLVCQICLQEVQSSRTLKVHYIRHFQLHFQKTYFTDTCPFCGKKFENVMSAQKHIATDHSDQSLIPLMETAKLWVDKSVILDTNSIRMKRSGVEMKKLDSSIVKKHLGDVDVNPESGTERTLSCAIHSCEKVFEKREQFLTHLAISHFWKDLATEFGDQFKLDALHCPVCKESVNPNMDKTTYYKHLAVNHEIVMKYVQNSKKEEPLVSDKEKSSNSSTSQSLLQRSFPRAIVQDEPPNMIPSSSDKDSEIDRILRKHGASSLVDGTSVDADNSIPVLASNKDLAPTSASSMNIKIKEEITTEDDTVVAASSELLSKIRNVFSDESDSE